MVNVWQTLPRPFSVLAPMEDVTDSVFRQIIAAIARPDLFVTEFTSVEGLFSRGRNEVIHRLRFDGSEKPIIAQLWGTHPEFFSRAVSMAVDMGFDGIDLNMGCPERSIIGHGGCGALINNPKLAVDIIMATKREAGSLPVSVKTRIGFRSIITEDWIGTLLSTDIDALTIHGRTVAEQSGVSAHWDEIGKAVAMRNRMRKPTVIIGNGDVMSLSEAHAKAHEYGVDGVMIGRGIFANPWVFLSAGRESHSPDELLSLFLRHVRLFRKTWGSQKNFVSLRKFVKMYVRGFDGAGELREKLMQITSIDGLETMLSEAVGLTHDL